MADRPNREKPHACVAKGKGHCRACNMRAVVTCVLQDSAFCEGQAVAVKEFFLLWTLITCMLSGAFGTVFIATLCPIWTWAFIPFLAALSIISAVKFSEKL